MTSDSIKLLNSPVWPILTLSLYASVRVCLCVCVFLDVMIVDKVLGARAVNLSHTDRYAARTPSRRRHMDAHTALCVCWCMLVICSLGVARIPRHILYTQIPVCVSQRENTVTDKASDISSFKFFFSTLLDLIFDNDRKCRRDRGRGKKRDG